MAKYFRTLIIVVFITGAGVWGFHQARFFEKLPLALSQTVDAADGEHGGTRRGRGNGFRGGAGQRGRGGIEHEENSFVGHRGRGQGRHAMTASPEGWINVLAYFSIFVFVVMLTYYGERGIRNYANRHEPCVTSS
jgi:hypothetical protein